MNITEKWIRTCQDCDNKQEDKQPIYGEELPLPYVSRKCKKCKSESLDYGSTYFYNDENKEIYICEECGEWVEEGSKHNCNEGNK